MDTELEQYKLKITNYSILQLEEIIVSLNKEKYPEKYQLVRHMLAFRLNPQDSIRTPFQQPQTASLKVPEDLNEPADQQTEVAIHTETQQLKEEQPSETLKKPTLTQPIIKPLKNIVPEKKELPSSHIVSSFPATEKVTAIKKKTDTEHQKQSTGILFPFLCFLILVTSIICVYILLLSFIDLPGKEQIFEFGKLLPDLIKAN